MTTAAAIQRKRIGKAKRNERPAATYDIYMIEPNDGQAYLVNRRVVHGVAKKVFAEAMEDPRMGSHVVILWPSEIPPPAWINLREAIANPDADDF